jgi:hypothetical protein
VQRVPSQEEARESDRLQVVEDRLGHVTSRMWKDVGELFKVIKDKRLFDQEGFHDFRAYVSSHKKKFGFDYKTVERAMGAVETLSNLPKDCPEPLLISHITAMSNGSPAVQARVWREVLETAGTPEKVTTKLVNLIKAKIEKQLGLDCAEEPPHPTVKMPSDQSYSTSNKWNTPLHIVEAVRCVFAGTIDLDPCSDEDAQRVVLASKHYTSLDNGLDRAKVWTGKVFVNPPYGMVDGSVGMQEAFMDRALEEHRLGNITECVILVKGAIGYKWFGKVLQSPHCMLTEKLRYENHGLPGCVAPFGSVVMYLGPNTTKFVEVFGALGHVPGHNSWSMSTVTM